MKKTTKVTTKEYDGNGKLIRCIETTAEEEIKVKDDGKIASFNPNIFPSINPIINPLLPDICCNANNPKNSPSVTYNVNNLDINDLAENINKELEKYLYKNLEHASNTIANKR